LRFSSLFFDHETPVFPRSVFSNPPRFFPPPTENFAAFPLPSVRSVYVPLRPWVSLLLTRGVCFFNPRFFLPISPTRRKLRCCFLPPTLAFAQKNHSGMDGLWMFLDLFGQWSQRLGNMAVFFLIVLKHSQCDWQPHTSHLSFFSRPTNEHGRNFFFSCEHVRPFCRGPNVVPKHSGLFITCGFFEFP